MAPSHNTGACLIRARKSDAIYFQRIQDENRFVHLHHTGQSAPDKAALSWQVLRGARVSPRSRSVIIHRFAIKSSFFMLLGACRLKRSILVLVLGLSASLSFISCGSSAKTGPPSGLCCRVLASQVVSSAFTFGSLVIVNGSNDTVPRVAPLSAGSSPGLMAISPSRNIAATFDATSNAVYAVDTVRESAIGNIRLPGATTSM